VSVKLNTKTNVFFFGMAAAVVAALLAVSVFSFRQFSLSSAQEQVQSAAEIVRVHLTESMANGTIDKRQSFLNRLDKVRGLLSSRVVRSPEVVRQFGPGLTGEASTDIIEDQVIAGGTPFFKLIKEGTRPVFRGTVPYVATAGGDTNCLQCHQVKEGTVLGAITLHISLSEQQSKALLTLALVTFVVAMFALISALFSRRMLRPLINTAESVQDAVTRAKNGDFSARIEVQSHDEIGQIAKDLNSMFGFLGDGLDKISNKVAALIRCNQAPGSNLLATTIDMVEGLEDVSSFKQAIDEDETKDEVYQRLAHVVRNEFLIDRFSIYEVKPSKNRLEPIVVDGEVGAECRWCDPQILLRSQTCRAMRTGHAVDSVNTHGICTAFRPPNGEEQSLHVCIPMIQSGTVGSVIQLVTDEVQAPMMQRMIPFMQVYFREAAPVLEGKRLMDSLRESTLRDPMTGLYNRRFLQEYVETLVAYADRQKQGFSILMADLDYFKQVNDTYGHEAGDTTLKLLARCMSESVRSSDMVIRYGGEEFLIVLRDTGDQSSDQVAEKIRSAVEDLKIEIPGAVLKKTLSIGVADYPNDSDSFWKVVKYADVALYRAKEAGRNRVLHFDPEMWSADEAY
jgi:diguanylate cyclase (GGDEF)-like protein